MRNAGVDAMVLAYIQTLTLQEPVKTKRSRAQTRKRKASRKRSRAARKRNR